MISLKPSGLVARGAPPAVAYDDGPARGGPAADIQVGVMSAHGLYCALVSQETARGWVVLGDRMEPHPAGQDA